jgi:rod shape-determining protein MreB
MVRGYLEQVNAFSIFSRPIVIVCVPYKANPVERRALEDVIFEAGARNVALIDEPLAAALGTGLRVGANRGSMILDIGGGSSEVAVISNGGIVASSSVRVAGDSFDSAIVDHVKSERNALIGEATAEQIKLKCGAAHPAFDSGEMQVAGRNLLSGMGCVLTVTSGEVREAISPSLDKIVTSVKQTLERTPPELLGDILKYGIIMTGGGSTVHGFDRLIQKVTGVPVRVADDAITCVSRGTGIALRNYKNLPEGSINLARSRRDRL